MDPNWKTPIQLRCIAGPCRRVMIDVRDKARPNAIGRECKCGWLFWFDADAPRITERAKLPGDIVRQSADGEWFVVTSSEATHVWIADGIEPSPFGGGAPIFQIQD